LQVPAIHYSRITTSAAEADVDLTSWQDSDLDFDSFYVDPSDATDQRLEDAPQALASIVKEQDGIAALGRAFFAGAGTNKHPLYKKPARRMMDDVDEDTEPDESAPPAKEPPAEDELAPARTQTPTRAAAPAPALTPRPVIWGLAPPASRNVAFSASPAEPVYIEFEESPASAPPPRTTDASTPAPADTVSRRLRLSAPEPRKRGLGWGRADIADAEAQCGLASGSFVFVVALALAAVAALVSYSQAHSQRLAIITGALVIFACGQLHCEGVDGAIDGLRWALNEGFSGLVAAARWTFNMAVGHMQFVVILLLLAYIATAGASPVKGATARAAPAALTLSQLTRGSARYDVFFRCSRGWRRNKCTSSCSPGTRRRPTCTTPSRSASSS